MQQFSALQIINQIGIMQKLYKQFILGLIFSVIGSNSIAQQLEVIEGPVIRNYGKTIKVDDAILNLNKNKEYRLLFDVYSDNSKKSKINPLINTVARFINMHVHQGVPLENLKIALVLHGSATKSALNYSAFKKEFGSDNPDEGLIEALTKANVSVYVCGQSFLAHGYEIHQKSVNVQLALSALTVLAEYQHKGFQLINFN